MGGDGGAVRMRPKTFAEMQPYMFAYGAGISVFSPASSLYQLLKLNPQCHPGPSAYGLALRILPVQTLLKAAQMNAATPIKENVNPWAAFGLVGILQGGVYGQANIYFAQKLNIGKKPSYAGMFRGVPYAGVRDMISQGVPYMFSGVVKEQIVDQIWPTEAGDEGANATKKWISVLSTSVVATYMSQSLHNIQITMQAYQDVSHIGAARKAWSENGFRLLYRGGEARVGLLLIVNVLNELLLKPAWEHVPDETVA